MVEFIYLCTSADLCVFFLCLCLCLRTRVHIYICMCVYVCNCMTVCMFIWVYESTSLRICECLNMYDCRGVGKYQYVFQIKDKKKISVNKISSERNTTSTIFERLAIEKSLTSQDYSNATI